MVVEVTITKSRDRNPQATRGHKSHRSKMGEYVEDGSRETNQLQSSLRCKAIMRVPGKTQRQEKIHVQSMVPVDTNATRHVTVKQSH